MSKFTLLEKGNKVATTFLTLYPQSVLSVPTVAVNLYFKPLVIYFQRKLLSLSYYMLKKRVKIRL